MDQSIHDELLCEGVCCQVDYVSAVMGGVDDVVLCCVVVWRGVVGGVVVGIREFGVSDEWEVVCTWGVGYLVKVKSNAFQNRSRFFRLTGSKLTYAEENCGKIISSVQR
jgi:hypothetical protein